MSWRREAAAVAVLSFDVDAESPILAQGRRYADHAMVMTHQAYGPLVGVPRILEFLARGAELTHRELRPVEVERRRSPER